MGTMRKYWYKSEPGAERRTWVRSSGPQLARRGCTDRSVLATQAGARAFPECLRIGGVEIRPATVLAPMAGVTDTVFRRFIKNLGGCGLIMTEFTSADGVLRNKKVRGKYLHFYEDEHPISAQLFGSNPEVLADAARMVEDLGFDLVDLNLGCPAKKVVMQWRLRPAARSAVDPQDFRIGAGRGEASLYGEISRGME